MSESFAELFEESLKTLDMEPGSIITGLGHRSRRSEIRGCHPA